MRNVVVIWAAAAALLAAGSAEAQRSTAPRLAPVAAGDLSPEQRAAIDAFAPIGMPNLAATYAHHPALPQILLPHLRYIVAESTLAPRERSLLALRTAWLARSPYLWAHLASRARGEGFSTADLERIARGPDAAGWQPFDVLLLRAADELVVDSIIADATWAALDERFDIPQLIDTIDTVGALLIHSGAANTLGVALETGLNEPLPNVPYAVAAPVTNLRLIGKAPRIPPVQPAGGGAAASANVFNTFRHNPPADRVRGAINNHVNRNTLETRQREFVVARIGVLCRSEYEYIAHVRSGRRAGFTDADVAMLLEGPDSSSAAAPLDRALVRATDELYKDYAVGDSTWATLAAGLGTPQLLDVLVAEGGYRSTSILINTAGVQLDANMAEFRFPPELR